MEYTSIALSLVAIIIAFYYYITKDRKCFEKRGIPCVPPVPILGNMASLVTKKCNMMDVIKKSYDVHPDAKYVGFFEFMRPIVLLRDLELIKSITMKHFDHFVDHQSFFVKETDPLFGGMLFSLKGEQWREQRGLLSPVFTSSKIKTMFKLMTACAVNFSDHLAKLHGNECDVEMKALLSMYTNDVIANCVYGVPVDTIADPKNPFYVNGRASNAFTGFLNSLKLMLCRNLPKVARFFRVKLMPQKTEDFFTNQVMSTLKMREENGGSYSDMIQLWIEANKKHGGKAFTPLQIACNAFIFFFGGFDTVSLQTSLLSYLLAEHQDVQERLQAEIDEAMEQCDGDLTYEMLQEMKYLDAVINETLRLYPAALFLDRMCVKEFELPPTLPGVKPFTIKPGMIVWIPVVALQRDPNYYDEPEKFDPDRFLNDGKKILNSGAYMPFGVGPRMCIGNRFALTQIKVLVCYLLARCNLRAGPKTVFPLKLDKGVLNVQPENGFLLRLEVRKNPPPSLHRKGEVNGICKNGI